MLPPHSACTGLMFFYRDLYVWLDDPFQAPPALVGVHDDAQQLAISW